MPPFDGLRPLWLQGGYASDTRVYQFTDLTTGETFAGEIVLKSSLKLPRAKRQAPPAWGPLPGHGTPSMGLPHPAVLAPHWLSWPPSYHAALSPSMQPTQPP